MMYIKKLQTNTLHHYEDDTRGAKYHDCALAFKVLLWSKNYIYSVWHINHFLDWLILILK